MGADVALGQFDPSLRPVSKHIHYTRGRRGASWHLVIGRDLSPDAVLNSRIPVLRLVSSGRL